MEHLDQMTCEYEAWGEIIAELRERGVGDIEHGGKDFTLYTAIVQWGEELAELRRLDPDPDHAYNALVARRLERAASIASNIKEA